MRRLTLLMAASSLSLASCTRDNPAFDDCLSADCIAAESGTGTPGDGDPGDGDGDGDTGDGDGDGDSGDGDGDSGDGDGDPGDGDGDGDPGLPACPNPAFVTIPLVEDTFLDASYGPGGCLISWDFANNMGAMLNLACNGLDFGGALGHWVCGEGSCNSTWLGRFAVADWFQLLPQVYEAGLVFTARIQSPYVNVAEAYALPAEGINYGNCGGWKAGEGEGVPPAACVTTHMYAAYDTIWPLAIDINVMNFTAIGGANIPSFVEPSEYQFVMPLDPALVQGWLTGLTPHAGVLLRTAAGEPLNFYLQAQNSGHEPELQVKLCVP